MKVDLLPCPECGSKAELKKSFYFGTNQMYSYVHCTNSSCDLFCHNPHFSGLGSQENDEHAAASWNERFAETPPLTPEEFEKLHQDDEKQQALQKFLYGFSWNRVAPFHEVHSNLK